MADEIVEATRILARHRLGAVVLWNPAVVVEGGVILDARLTSELLVALAVPEYLNRLHRGAVLIRRARVERAAVPITWADVIERAAELGTGVAIAIDGDTGAIRIADRTASVEVVGAEALADALRRGRR